VKKDVIGSYKNDAQKKWLPIKVAI